MLYDIIHIKQFIQTDFSDLFLSGSSWGITRSTSSFHSAASWFDSNTSSGLDVLLLAGPADCLPPRRSKSSRPKMCSSSSRSSSDYKVQTTNFFVMHCNPLFKLVMDMYLKNKECNNIKSTGGQRMKHAKKLYAFWDRFWAVDVQQCWEAYIDFVGWVDG